MVGTTRTSRRIDILLWRHAEAAPGHDDLRRPLTPHGERQAQAMAAWLREHAPKALQIRVSPAVRCQSTAAALERPFTTDARLAPDAAVADIVDCIGQPATLRSAFLIVGHQPTLGRVAAWLMTGEETDWPIRKGALWWLTCREDRAARFSLTACLPPGLTGPHR